MKFAVLPPYRTGVTADPEWMVAFARHAEDTGMESVYAVEHVVVPGDYATRYPYSPTGRMPLPVDIPIPDPLELLAYLAAATRTIRLGTGILVLPEHHPVMLAKRVATLDRLSGGRVTLGVGAGWMREELAMVDVDFASRGRRMDESVDALRLLWADGTASFHGEFWNFDDAGSYPKPVQAGGVPIHIGGHSPAAARRAGARGDGFQPLGLDEALLGERLGQMREAADAAGRDAAAIEVSLSGLLESTGPEEIERASAQGAHRLVLSTRDADLDVVRGQLDDFAKRAAG